MRDKSTFELHVMLVITTVVARCLGRFNSEWKLSWHIAELLLRCQYTMIVRYSALNTKVNLFGIRLDIMKCVQASCLYRVRRKHRCLMMAIM